MIVHLMQGPGISNRILNQAVMGAVKLEHEFSC